MVHIIKILLYSSFSGIINLTYYRANYVLMLSKLLMVNNALLRELCTGEDATEKH